MERLRAVGGAVVAAGALVLSGLVAQPAAAGGTVTFTTVPPQAVVGGPGYTPSASDGSQQATISIDVATANGACTLSAGVVSFPHAGSCVIDATVPNDPVAQQTFAVAAAGTTTALSVSPAGLQATVSATPPGGGTPVGIVSFTVGGRSLGSADLMNGVATLSYSVPPNVTEQIVATYQGDADYQGSDASQIARGPDIQPPFLVRPRITARLTSRWPRNRHGWWHTRVRVHFSCSAPGTVIIGGCPRAVRLWRSGRNLTVTRTIRTTAGGRARVTVRAIKIDLTRPRVEIAGVRGHALYRDGTPRARCVASDRISGIAGCTITKHVRRGGTLRTITFTATAISRAGVRSSVAETVYSKL
jgi:hypothetical protein